MDFVPTDYKQPSTGGNYAKIEKGENKFRILSKPIFGWVAWKDKKPHRFPFSKKPEGKFDDPVRHFWAMIVWNYKTEAIQVLELTQATIHSALIDLSRSEEWGSPTSYDIKIVKSGEDKNTKYTVLPNPKKPIPDSIKQAALDKPILLDLMLQDKDPFEVTDASTELELEALPF